MKSKTHPIKNTNSLLRKSIALAAAGFVTIGLSACDDNDSISENQTRMEEPMINSQNDTPNPTMNSTPNAMGDSTQDTSSDTWITAKVKTELLADDISKGFDIEVTTVDGVVSLDGKVKDSDTIMHLQQIVRSVEGVSQVDVSGLRLEEARAY